MRVAALLARVEAAGGHVVRWPSKLHAAVQRIELAL